jgi:hypothetical protein
MMEVQSSFMLYLSLGNQPNHYKETWVDQTAYSDKLPKRKISEPSLMLLFIPLNAELNPMCHFLALLGAHPILHVGRVRVNNPLHTTIFTYHITHVLRF